ncbi:MAG: hypothetical protein ACYTGB_06385, partial [Planctomycetota bacterium]
GNGKSDDRDAAEYYAKRRGIPDGNLLALKVESPRGVDYVVFYDRILKPIRDRLAAKGADGQPFGKGIVYIALAPGVPMRLNTNHTRGEHPVRPGFGGAGRRSVDQWLISLEANFAAGVQRETKRPGRTGKITFGQVWAGKKPLVAAKVGDVAISSIKVDGRPLVSIPVEEEGRLGDLVVAGKKLGDIPVGEGKLGELNVGTEKKPLKLGDVEVRIPALGSHRGHISMRVLGRFVKPGPGFAELRAQDKSLAGCYLVTRLGKDLASSRRCVDGALYAERYLRGAAAGGETPADALPEPAVWLDQKFRFARDQVASQIRCTALVHPWEKGLFKPGAPGPLAPWKLVIDNQIPEIGLRAKDAKRAHRPTATAKISAVAPDGVVTLEKIRYAKKELPAAPYFCPGWELRIKGRTGKEDPKATIREVRPAANQLVLSSTQGFEAGSEIVSEWAGEYPSTDCFYFFGFYGLGRHEDVFAFPPGAVGIHVDSSCMRWAHGSLGRGIAATYGVVNEPFSAGIPYGDLVLAALVRGRSLGEAMTGATFFPQRWAGVTFGDPLYSPFRGAKIADSTAPVIARAAAASEKTGVRVSAELGGKTADELADVALFRVEYGLDARYGQALDFYEWPEPENPGKVKGRNYTGYARQFSRVLTGLEKGKTYHYRVVARDPGGNTSAGADATFKWE